MDDERAVLAAELRRLQVEVADLRQSEGQADSASTRLQMIKLREAEARASRLLDIYAQGVDALGSPEDEEGALTCPICCTIVERPYTLPCGHTYDLEGLAGYSEVRREGTETAVQLRVTSSFSCAVCRRDVMRGTVLHENRQLKDILENFARGIKSLRNVRVQVGAHAEGKSGKDLKNATRHPTLCAE